MIVKTLSMILLKICILDNLWPVWRTDHQRLDGECKVHAHVHVCIHTKIFIPILLYLLCYLFWCVVPLACNYKSVILTQIIFTSC